MRGNSLVMGIALFLSLAPFGFGEDQDQGTPEKAVRAAIDSYVKAFNMANADAVAEHWAKDARYTLPSGQQVAGRAAIRDVFAKLFSEKQPPKLEIVEGRVRILTKDVALEEGVVRVTNAEQAPEDSSYVAVHVRQGKEWKLTSVHETVLPTAAEPKDNSVQPLQELEWLVGDWEEKTSTGTAETHFRWSKNRSFLTCQFKVSVAKDQVLEGTQVIGWDPESEVIRSWIFDSNGGFGEGLWTRTNNLWSVKFVQVLADGRRVAATNIYTQLDANTFEWKSIGRKIDGGFAPNIGPFQVKRVESSPSFDQSSTADTK